MNESRFTAILRYGLIISLFGLGMLLAYLGITMHPDSIMGKVAAVHFQAVIGLPSAAFASLFLVLILRQASGPIKFEILTAKFEGSSGEIVLWIFTFLAIVLAINTSW